MQQSRASPVDGVLAGANFHRPVVSPPLGHNAGAAPGPRRSQEAQKRELMLIMRTAVARLHQIDKLVPVLRTSG